MESNLNLILFVQALAASATIFCLTMIVLCVWTDYFVNANGRRESSPELTQMFTAAWMALILVGWSSTPIYTVRQGVAHLASRSAACITAQTKLLCHRVQPKKHGKLVWKRAHQRNRA